MTTMDFFGHQERARKRSSVLVLLFALAVACIVLLVYAAAVLTLNVTDARAGFWQPEALLIVVGGTLALVLAAAGFRTAQLRSGGHAVAEMLGGREVDPTTEDLLEKTLLNVVEEMAIASGVPVPRVYVLDREKGLNAFAAGWSTNDAAVAVTRGLLERMNRDQLQGVIAHEFSHVFNGDMRLNIRLMGTLFGILCLTTIGRLLLRAGYGGSRSRNRGGGGIVVFGLLLVVIGSIGVLFARMIQAAISRQREFLADASAVQFTRNPRGIGTALAVIGGLGSRISSPHAEEASHFYFANGVRSSLLGLFATHPPIQERVERVLPGFTREWKERGGEIVGMAAAASVVAAGLPPAPGLAGIAGIAGAAGSKTGIAPAKLLSSVGAPTDEHVRKAREILAGLPLELAAAAREPMRARAIACALLLDADKDRRAAQLAMLGPDGAELRYETTVLYGPIAGLPRSERLPLLELSIPALRRLPRPEIADLRERLRKLAMADGVLSPFESALMRTVERHVRLPGDPPPKPGRALPLQSLSREASAVLSVIARSGQPGEEAAAAAFAAGARVLIGMAMTLLPEASCTPEALDRALDALNRASPLGKGMLLKACAEAAGSDGVIEPAEAELLRAVAEHWGCPVPPIAAGDATSRSPS